MNTEKIITENLDSLYAAVKQSAMQDVLGIDAYMKFGFIPGNLEHESVSKTLEYAFDDWCIEGVFATAEEAEDKAAAEARQKNHRKEHL